MEIDFPLILYLLYIFFLRTSFISHKLLFNEGSFKIVLTILGLDGYLSYRIKTYYLVGEWFLGAIIIIYSLYPLVLWFKNKHIFIFISSNCILYYLMYKTGFFVISQTNNLITCINSFFFGMFIINYKKFVYGNIILLLFSLVLLLFLCLVKINSSFILIMQIQGLSLYIILIIVGKFLMSKIYSQIFKQISNLSYSIYLFHHRIINDIQGINNPNEWYLHLLLLGAVIALTIIASSIHSMVVNSIMKSKIFKKLDTFF